MVDPASQLLQCYSGRLSQVVLSEESVQLLHKEGLLSKEASAEVESCGCVLVGVPWLLVLSAVAEDHNKLKLLAGVLLKSDEAMSLAKELAEEYGE